MDPIDFVPLPHPESVDVTRAPKGKDLGAMLEAGEIDGLFSADVPQCVLKRSPNVARLFPDSKRVEREYYGRTGIFPIMHLAVVRRELAERHPEVVEAVYTAFCASKAAAMQGYRTGRAFNHIDIMVPWFSALFEEDRTLFPDDWWPYGVEANRAAVDTVLRYHFEQGLTKRRLTCEDIFVPGLLVVRI